MNDLIKRLEEYNRWRRGADIPQPCPEQLGKDIDEAVRILKQARGRGNGDIKDKDH